MIRLASQVRGKDFFETPVIALAAAGLEFVKITWYSQI